MGEAYVAGKKREGINARWREGEGEMKWIRIYKKRGEGRECKSLWMDVRERERERESDRVSGIYLTYQFCQYY